jgi:ATP-dependent exoDNAse (exonuclease V) beta subunit
MECPAKYYLRHVLGMPELTSSPYTFDENEDASDILPGDVVGSITHSILQQIHSSEISPDQMYRMTAEQVISVPSITEKDKDRYISEVQKKITKFLISEYGKKILSASHVKAELSLTMAIGEDFLTGTIDRLFKNDSPNWTILDYKTDHISIDDILGQADSYKPQLSVYALLAGSYFNQRSVDASLVFLDYPDRPIHFHFDTNKLETFKNEVHHIIDEIKKDYFQMNLRSCSRCPFNPQGKCIATGIATKS